MNRITADGIGASNRHHCLVLALRLEAFIISVPDSVMNFRVSLELLPWVTAELLERTVEMVGDLSINSPCHLKNTYVYLWG